MDTADDEWKALRERMTPGLARNLRVIVTAGQLNTQIPEPSKPQPPKENIGDAVANHPVIKNIGSELMPTQEAANFFTSAPQK